MATFNDATEALQVVREHLQSRLDADYSSQFEPYGGVDVITPDDEPDEDDRAGKPYIILSIEGDALSDASGSTGDMRDATLEAECVANDFNGAVTGAANPTGSDTLLSRALAEIARDDYAVLRDAGLYRFRQTASREVINTADGMQLHRNPHRFLFSYFTPED
jgi:hypothetical protein